MIVTEFTIQKFIADCKAEGISNLWAALPASSALIKSGKVAQIRKVKTCFASGVDELGNVVILARDGYIKQLSQAEYKKLK